MATKFVSFKRYPEVEALLADKGLSYDKLQTAVADDLCPCCRQVTEKHSRAGWIFMHGLNMNNLVWARFEQHGPYLNEQTVLEVKNGWYALRYEVDSEGIATAHYKVDSKVVIAHCLMPAPNGSNYNEVLDMANEMLKGEMIGCT